MTNRLDMTLQHVSMTTNIRTRTANQNAKLCNKLKKDNHTVKISSIFIAYTHVSFVHLHVEKPRHRYHCTCSTSTVLVTSGVPDIL